ADLPYALPAGEWSLLLRSTDDTPLSRPMKIKDKQILVPATSILLLSAPPMKDNPLLAKEVQQHG
ncbi:MAG TPA: hypothetical protein VFX11_05955, partial [Candidatus Kapabacteria bacterium]|nr:hypothetical protein [Candidatus Kapabacteria bacterium]